MFSPSSRCKYKPSYIPGSKSNFSLRPSNRPNYKFSPKPSFRSISSLRLHPNFLDNSSLMHSLSYRFNSSLRHNCSSPKFKRNYSLRLRSASRPNHCKDNSSLKLNCRFNSSLRRNLISSPNHLKFSSNLSPRSSCYKAKPQDYRSRCSRSLCLPL